MTKVTFKMTGLRELERALGELPKATRRRVGLKVLREGGEPIAKAARALVRVRSGDLRESYDVGTNLAPSQRGDRGAVAPVEVYVGPGQNPQAITEEFGTFDQEAHPSLTPAWEGEKINALDIIGTKLGIEIENTARRLGPKGK